MFEGKCNETSCGNEAACVQTDDRQHYYCLCPHDAEPPTADFRCPTRNTGN